MALKSIILSAAETDLQGKSPFLVGGDAVAINLTASGVTVQHSDTSGSGFVTAGVAMTAATGLTPTTTITGLKRYVKLSAAGTAILLGA